MESSSVLPPPLPEKVVEPARPWGFWATIGFSVLIAIGYLAPQLGIGMVMAIVAIVRADGKEPDWVGLEERMGSDGGMLAIGTLASAPIVVGLAVWFAWLRKGISVKDYLGLRWPERKVVSRWCIGLLALVAVSDALTSALGRDIVTEFMLEAWRSAGALKILLALALVVGAPLTEEFLFRGFLFVGLWQSRLGAIGAAVITAGLWAIIHSQYDFYGVATIFVGGLFLAAARVKTNSLWLCVLLHSIMNVIATIQVIVLEGM